MNTELVVICDRVRPGQDPATVHDSMLADLAREAGRAAWKGVTFTRYGFVKSEGRILIEAREGTAAPTLENLKRYSMEAKR